ncbi:MAG: OsmC family protein [Gemmatimonadota bacterium]
MSEAAFSLTVTLQEGYKFDVAFDNPDWPTILVDEPEPLGEDAGPNASRLLGAAVGNCLAASLLFCLQKARVEVQGLTARVSGVMTRNEKGRLRIGRMDVVLEPVMEGVPSGRLDRCLDIFEDFCVVTQSVRGGIDVNVTVEPPG